MTSEQVKKLVQLLLENRSDYVWYNKFDECYETDEDYLHFLITKFVLEESDASRTVNS